MNFQFLDTLSVSKQVENSVSSNLRRVVSGSEDVLTSPIVKRKAPEDILKGWDEIVKENLSAMNADLINLEESNKLKFGPRSIAAPWGERTDGVLSYFAEDTLFTPPTVSKVPRRNLRPISEAKALGFLKNSTNSGLPYYTKKGKVKEIYSTMQSPLLSRKDPCVMFTRTQEQRKTRTVWGYPMADTLREMQYYEPILGYQRKLNWRNSLSGPDAVNRKMSDLVTKAISSDQYLLSIDFSAYDASVKTTLQKASFDYFKSLYQADYHEEIDDIATRFNTIGLVTPDGIIDGPHGVPSGSTFTNEVDSVAQYLIATEYGLSSDNFDIQGDDGAYVVSDPDSLKDYFRKYNLVVNDDKSYISKDYLIYLQNLYHKDYMRDGIIGGIYPTYRALNRIVYLERFTDFLEDDLKGQDYFSLRTISILENCKFHPLFEELVKYVASLDKYKLKYSNSGLAKYTQRASQSSGVAGIFKYRYEDDPKGLNNFDTVKLLKEL
ncbi:RdRp [Beihai picobirnavirus 7]|uniref:RdRp n=2 Tax=Riboviria TaxID=2559587 RepID=A0A1L3KLE1_9VIRU|nr:RdRp [Beihai picobirna-like virus 7]APG78163.1 RdRp [Beihai picobirna-like virus 7]APG78166.1 RdRp [Beihai picobirna-like virus 7]APG78172.1 RdRp [Beihai picobirna-like virus 7]APG78184.1 RdRp [Beihai picobirna-like virus 7]APG78192.1 RdRp [Beihai picobirna-like virus 7]